MILLTGHLHDGEHQCSFGVVLKLIFRPMGEDVAYLQGDGRKRLQCTHGLCGGFDEFQCLVLYIYPALRLGCSQCSPFCSQGS